MRDQRLDAKEKELEAHLELWVRENQILLPGQRLVFSMRIEQTPMVIPEERLDASVLEWDVSSFFLQELFQARGCSRPLATRMRNGILDSIALRATVRDFIKQYPHEQSLRHVKNIGKLSNSYLLPIMQELWTLTR